MARRRFAFRYLEPTFFAGLLDDPVLYLRVRPDGRALLCDCGQVHHLAKRVLRSVDALFVSHAHMDHFMGFDTFIRNNHVSSRTFDIYGPPGIARKTAGKLAGYDWNLTEPSWCTLRVHELFADRTATFAFPGAEGFPCRPVREEARRDRVIHRTDRLTVEAEVCDHRIPSLIFRVTEAPPFDIDEQRLEQEGLVRGEWLRDLQRSYHGGFMDRAPCPVLRRKGEAIEAEEVTDPRALYESIRKAPTAGAVGYVSDVGFDDANLARVLSLMAGVTLLVCECTFLAAERDKARLSGHLCTADLNELMERLRPPFVLPMHLSKSYLGRSRLLYDELSPPPGVTILRLPEHVVPRPLLPSDIPSFR